MGAGSRVGGVTARTGSGSTLLASGGSRTNCSLESESVSWLMTAASPRASRPSKASSSSSVRRRGGARAERCFGSGSAAEGRDAREEGPAREKIVGGCA